MHSKNQKRHGSSVPSRSSLVLMKAKAPAVAGGPGDPMAFRIPKDYPHSRFSKAPLAVYPPKGARSKPCVSLPVVSLEKMPCLSRANSASQIRLSAPSSSPSSSPLKQPPLPPGDRLPNGRGNSGPSTPRSSASPSSLDGRPSPARSPLDRRPSPSPSPSPAPSPALRTAPHLSSPSEKKNPNGTKASSRPHNRLSGRIFDPDKHCGVQDPETKQPCTRSLTCKTHSLTHRRAVPGRRKHFDVLLAEHRGRTKEKEGAKEKEKDKDGCSPSASSQDAVCLSKPPCPNGRPLSTLKLKLAYAHIPRVPGMAPSMPQPPAPAPFPAPPPFPTPPSNAELPTQPRTTTTTMGGDSERLSSDECDNAPTPDDPPRPDFHFTHHHPQPLGFCIFSSRLMGRGHYVFDRRWDRMRAALQNMVEKHLNAQMWRKVPLAAESLHSLSHSGAPRQAPPPSPTSDACPPLTAPSSSSSFPPLPSSPGGLISRDPPQPIPALSASRHGALRASRPTKEREDSIAEAKRKNSSCSFRNGTGAYHPPPQASAGSDAAARKKGHRGQAGGNGIWSYGAHWFTKAGQSSHPSDLGNPNISYSSSRELAAAATAAPSSGTLSYGQKAEGRKRKSAGPHEGKSGNKLSRLGGADGFFGNDSESQRQAKMHH